MPKATVRVGPTSEANQNVSAGRAGAKQKSSHPHKNPAPPRKQGEEEEEPGGSRLPMVSAIDDPVTMRRAAELLKEAERLKKRNDEDDARLKEIRQELGVVADAFQMPGFRWGGIGFSYLGLRSNKKLSIAKLVENGVDPELIKDCYEESKPFVDSRLIFVRA